MSDLPQLTTVPTVIDALLTAFREIPDSLDTAYGTLQVHDGPTYSSSAHDIIAVGVGDPGVVHQIIPQNRGVALNESYDIRWLQWSWTGSRDMAKHRERCLEVVSAMREAVDGLEVEFVNAIRFGESFTWTQSTSGEGCCCSVSGSINVAARF